MWPLTASRPKALLPVGGMPFLEMQLRWLSMAGVTEVLMAVGTEQRESWDRYLADRIDDGGLRIEVTAEPEPLDTAGALVDIKDRLAERFLVLNGDVILDIDPEMLLASPGNGSRARLTLTVVDDASSYGAVRLDGAKVIAFDEKPDLASETRATVNAGLYLMERSVLEGLPPGRRSLERDVFPLLASKGELGGVIGEGAWVDIGTPQRYIEAHDSVASGQTKLYDPDLRGGVFVAQDGDWAWVGPGATVDPTARLRPRRGARRCIYRGRDRGTRCRGRLGRPGQGPCCRGRIHPRRRGQRDRHRVRVAPRCPSRPRYRTRRESRYFLGADLIRLGAP